MKVFIDNDEDRAELIEWGLRDTGLYEGIPDHVVSAAMDWLGSTKVPLRTYIEIPPEYLDALELTYLDWSDTLSNFPDDEDAQRFNSFVGVVELNLGGNHDQASS